MAFRTPGTVSPQQAAVDCILLGAHGNKVTKPTLKAGPSLARIDALPLIPHLALFPPVQEGQGGGSRQGNKWPF